MLVWVDLETTGLDPWSNEILEMAAAITDDQLNIKWMQDWLLFPVGAVDWRPETWEPIVQEMHVANGLLDDLVTKKRVSIDTALSEFGWAITEYKATGSPLCGNSVHMDRYFLLNASPIFMKNLHYRCIDVSSIKELVKRWYPTLYESRPWVDEAKAHRARADILHSIEEMRWYRNNAMVPSVSGFNV